MLFEELDITQRMAKNTSFAIAGNIISRLINFFIVLSLARYLGKDLFGQYGFIFAFLSIFDVIIEFGFIQILIREISKDRAKAELLVGNALIIRFFIVLLCLFGSWIAISLLGYSANVRFLVFIASFTFFMQMRSIFEVIFRVRLKMQYPAIESIIRTLSYGLLVLLVIYLRLSLLAIILVNILSGAIGLAFLIPLSFRHLKPRLQFDFGITKHLLRQSFPLMLSSIFIILYYKIDVVMLSKMKSFVDIGYYTAATRLVESLVIFPITIVISVYPVISEVYKVNKEIFNKICHRVFVFLFAIAVPICILTSLFSKQIIGLLYGSQYLPASLALSILIWANCFIFVMFLSTHMLISIERQHIDTIIALFMVISNVIFNLFLIPRYSFIGASIAILLSAGLGCFLAWMYLFRTINFHIPIIETNKLIVINALLLIISFIILRLTTINWLIYSLIYGSVYCFLLFHIGILPINFSYIPNKGEKDEINRR